MGVRPNSPPQTTSVSSSMPLCFQILDQSCTSLVRLFALLFDSIFNVAVMVPARMVELNEAYTSFGKSSCQEAVLGKGTWVFGRGAIKAEGRSIFGRQIHQFGCSCLHPIGHLITFDPSGYFIQTSLIKLLLIEIFNQIQCVSLGLLVDSRRVRNVKDRVTTGAKWDALMFTGQEARAPHGSTPGKVATTFQHNKTRQIDGFTANAVG